MISPFYFSFLSFSLKLTKSKILHKKYKLNLNWAFLTFLLCSAWLEMNIKHSFFTLPGQEPF